MAEKRIVYFDMAKGVGIFLVVLGHIEQAPKPLCIWIQSFHMPLFFILSGMLIHYKGEAALPFSTLLFNKFQHIIVPYISFSFLYFLIDCVRILFFSFTWKDLIKNVFLSISFYGKSVLWFLPGLFFGELLFLLLLKKFHRHALNFSLILSIMAYGIKVLENPFFTFLLSIDRYFVYFLVHLITALLRVAIVSSFIGLGYYFFRILNKKRRRIKEFTLSLVFLLISFLINMINKSTDLHFMELNNLFLYYIGAISGSLCIIFICKNIPSLSFLCFWGRNSLIVMSTHIDFYILYMASLLSLYFNQFITRAKVYVFCVTVMTLVFLIEYPVITIIQKYFGFFLGQQLIFRKKSNHL